MEFRIPFGKEKKFEKLISQHFIDRWLYGRIFPHTIHYLAKQKLNSDWIDNNSVYHYFPRENDDISEIRLKDSVTEIGDEAFYDCEDLIRIVLPDSLTSIGEYAFWKCIGLKSIFLPDSIKRIGGDAFRECSALTSITLPDSVTDIGDYAFAECRSLKKIVISKGSREKYERMLDKDLWKKIIEK